MSKLPPHLARAKRDLNDYRMRPTGFEPNVGVRGVDYQNVIIVQVWHKDIDSKKPTEHRIRQLFTAPRLDGKYQAVDCDCPDHNDPSRWFRRCRHMYFFDAAGGLELEDDAVSVN